MSVLVGDECVCVNILYVFSEFVIRGVLYIL